MKQGQPNDVAAPSVLALLRGRGKVHCKRATGTLISGCALIGGAPWLIRSTFPKAISSASSPA